MWGVAGLPFLLTLCFLACYLDGWAVSLSTVFTPLWVLDGLVLVLSVGAALVERDYSGFVFIAVFWVPFFVFRLLLVLKFDGFASGMSYPVLFIPIYVMMVIYGCPLCLGSSAIATEISRLGAA